VVGYAAKIKSLMEANTATGVGTAASTSATSTSATRQQNGQQQQQQQLGDRRLIENGRNDYASQVSLLSAANMALLQPASPASIQPTSRSIQPTSRASIDARGITGGGGGGREMPTPSAPPSLPTRDYVPHAKVEAQRF
jgi:hypothetical protein